MMGLWAKGETTASINSVWLEHNVTQNGKIGMNVHCDFHVAGMKGHQIECIAFFYDEDRERVGSSCVGYQTRNNKACTYDTSKATYDDTRWSDFCNFIPVEALDFKEGTHTYYCKVYIRDEDSNTLVSSELYPFEATGVAKKQTPQVVNLPDGSWQERVVNADGTVSSVIHSKCYSCKASGVCSACHGAGGRMVGMYRPYYTVCMLCEGGGKCKYCGGTGESLMYTTFDPSSSTAHGTNPYTGKTYDATPSRYDDSSDNSGSSSSRSSSKETCKYCKGIGYDVYPYLDGIVGMNIGGYTNQDGAKCPYCSERRWHQHPYCPHCYRR